MRTALIAVFDDGRTFAIPGCRIVRVDADTLKTDKRQAIEQGEVLLEPPAPHAVDAPEAPHLSIAIFPLFRNGDSGDAIEQDSAPLPPAFRASLERARAQLDAGIFDGEDEESSSRADALDISIEVHEGAD